MVEEFNNLHMKPQNVAQLKVILQTTWENLQKPTFIQVFSFLVAFSCGLDSCHGLVSACWLEVFVNCYMI